MERFYKNRWPGLYGSLLLVLLSTMPMAIPALYAQTLKPAPATVLVDSSLVRIQSPSKAALYSALLPGLGQAYNKKYWKIPLIYAGFGTMTYFIVTNGKEYNKFKDAYEYANGDSLSGKYNEYVDKYAVDELQAGRDYYRRNRDLTIIVTSFWYLLNVVDAAVDAYLFEYDVSDDLSMRIEPSFNPRLYHARVPAELKLTFRIGSH